MLPVPVGHYVREQFVQFGPMSFRLAPRTQCFECQLKILMPGKILLPECHAAAAALLLCVCVCVFVCVCVCSCMCVCMSVGVLPKNWQAARGLVINCTRRGLATVSPRPLAPLALHITCAILCSGNHNIQAHTKTTICAHTTRTHYVHAYTQAAPKP